MSSEIVLKRIKEIIYNIIPDSVDITKIEFEGPEVSIYSKDISILAESDELITNIARTIRKRVVVRPDESIRKSSSDVKKIINDILKDEVNIGDIDFDYSLGNVIIHVDKPNKVLGKGSNFIKKIIRETSWRPLIYRIPPIQSNVIRSIRNVLATDTEARKNALLSIGKIVHRELLLNEPIIRITALGGYKEVGRSSNLLTTGDANVLIDCGVSVGSSHPSNMLPRFDLPEFSITDLDAVVITHAHLDHSGFVPFLFKYGYEGPIYTTEPTRDLMTMLQIDYLDIAEKEGKLLPYSKMDIRKATLHTITIGYGEVTDIAPGVKLTFHNAGHIVGSAIAHLHIGSGKYNIAFAHDFKFANSYLLDRAIYKYLRLETIVMESTYGSHQDVMPNREETEETFRDIVTRTINRGGKVLIPVLAVGRAQELQLVIENMVKNKQIPMVPVYLDGMIKEATAVTISHPEFLSKSLKERIFQNDDNPFLATFFETVTDQDKRDKIIYGEPCIIMATSGMLVGGPSVHYFKGLVEDEKNSLIFVSYQGKNTLGRKIYDGATEVVFKDENNKSYALKVNMEITRIRGFTGHSDRKELLEFAKRLSPRPKQYILVHGDANKCDALASSIGKMVKRDAIAPKIGDTIRLY